jgi:hypothetical protein
LILNNRMLLSHEQLPISSSTDGVSLWGIPLGDENECLLIFYQCSAVVCNLEHTT